MSFKQIKVDTKIFAYFSGNPPSVQEKNCLTNAFVKIKRGAASMTPAGSSWFGPFKKNLYHVFDCGHLITVSVNKSNTVAVVLNAQPLQAPSPPPAP